MSVRPAAVERGDVLVAGQRARDAARELLPCRRAWRRPCPASAITSETAKRPPGRSTRAASRSTCVLSAERLITQLEITTSTLASGSGIASMWPLSELDVLDAGLGRVGPRELEHLVGHVEADRLAGRADAARARGARRCRRPSRGRARSRRRRDRPPRSGLPQPSEASDRGFGQPRRALVARRARRRRPRAVSSVSTEPPSVAAAAATARARRRSSAAPRRRVRA